MRTVGTTGLAGQPREEGDQVPVLRRGGQVPGHVGRGEEPDLARQEAPGDVPAQAEGDPDLLAHGAGVGDRGGFLAARACNLLILKDGNLEKVVGARGFELLAQLSGQYRQCSPVPRKQRRPRHFAQFPNAAEHA